MNHAFTRGTSKALRVRPLLRLNGRGAKYNAMPPAVASVYNGLSDKRGSRPSTAKSSSESSVSFIDLDRKAEMGFTTGSK